MFSSQQIWKTFPILMPCLVVALFNLVGFILAYFCLEEVSNFSLLNLCNLTYR